MVTVSRSRDVPTYNILLVRQAAKRNRIDAISVAEVNTSGQLKGQGHEIRIG